MSLTDNFNRADANPIGGNWTTWPTLAALRIVSNQLANAGSAADSGAYYSGSSWNNDQSSQYTAVTASSDDKDYGPAVRISSSVNSGYFVGCTSGAGKIYKFVGGSFSQIQSGGAAWSTNDLIKLDATSTTIAFTRNGGADMSTTDSSISSGSPGAFMYLVAGRLDDWVGTGESAAAPSTAKRAPRRMLMGVG